jgi:hypothetical protein
MNMMMMVPSPHLARVCVCVCVCACMQPCPCACVGQCLHTSTHGQTCGQPTTMTCASAGASAGSRPSLASVAEPPGLAKAARVEDADATGDIPSEEVDAGSGGGRVLGAPLPSTPLAVQTSAQVMRGARRSSAHAHLAGTGSPPRSLRPSVVVTRCAPLPPTSAQLQATMRRRRPCCRPRTVFSILVRSWRRKIRILMSPARRPRPD